MDSRLVGGGLPHGLKPPSQDTPTGQEESNNFRASISCSYCNGHKLIGRLVFSAAMGEQFCPFTSFTLKRAKSCIQTMLEREGRAGHRRLGFQGQNALDQKIVRGKRQQIKRPRHVQRQGRNCFREPPKLVLAGFTGGSHFYTMNRTTSSLQGTDRRATNLPEKSLAPRELYAQNNMTQ